MGSPTDRFLNDLTSSKRVVILGGLAVIAHGLSRTTDDADIWLEPMENAEEWCRFLEEKCGNFDGLTIHRLPMWTPVTGYELVEAIEETGILRILGLDCPLDIFRKPNEFEPDDFDGVFQRSTPNSDGTNLPHSVDLIVTKSLTNRSKDHQDLAFLESITKEDYFAKLPTATFEEAQFMLDRFAEWQVLEAALTNPSPNVQALATGILKEFAEGGDPFSRDILEGRKTPDRP